MKKIELSQGIIQYLFEPVPGQCYSNNIVALLNEDKAILIDTGYEYQALKVAEDLKDNNIIIEKVIISHFHRGHVGGLKVLSGVDVYGSSQYNQTLSLWTTPEDIEYYTPTLLVDKNLKIRFGTHEIELIQNPGHTLCTILIKINNQYLHIADELTFTNTGESILPRITKNDVINSYISVHNLKRYSNYTLIPGHGNAINNPDLVDDKVRNVCHYLCEILSHDDYITFEEATQKCTCTFYHDGWHDNVYK
jgi:glyoxylase-like metal-dependent hydrolase (beta-lactamase superfamily II)